MRFVPRKIKKIRKEKGLSREDLAFKFREEKAKISPRTILNWEKGISKPNAEDLVVMCHIFGSPVTYFFA
jgi:transcriptional regulator with XRE-family HTH domain